MKRKATTDRKMAALISRSSVAALRKMRANKFYRKDVRMAAHAEIQRRRETR